MAESVVSDLFPRFCCSHFYSDVLQCVVWQVLYTPDVWLLSNLGAQLGIQEEGDHRGNPTRCSWHHQSTGERISSCISRDCLQSIVRISAHLSQILSSNYRWGNQQILQFIGEKSHLSQSLSSVCRWEISTFISELVLSRPVRISFPVSQILSSARLLNLWGEKAYGIKKHKVLKEVSIRPLKWVYGITGQSYARWMA